MRPSTYVLTSLALSVFSVNLSSLSVRRFFFGKSINPSASCSFVFLYLSNLILRGFFMLPDFNVKCAFCRVGDYA